MVKRGRGWVGTPDTSGNKTQQGKRTKKYSAKKEQKQPHRPSESRNEVDKDAAESPAVPAGAGAAAVAIEKAANRKGKGKGKNGDKNKSKVRKVEESCSRSE
ncbi:unnamed protein product, partial [Laminaria digitata]